MSRWNVYGKALAAVILAAVTAVQAVLSDGRVTPVEWVQIAIAVVTALLVYVVPVVPAWPHAKSVIGAVLAGLNVLVTVMVGGWNSGSATEAVLAVATAVFVRYAPAQSTVNGAVAG